MRRASDKCGNYNLAWTITDRPGQPPTIVSGLDVWRPRTGAIWQMPSPTTQEVKLPGYGLVERMGPRPDREVIPVFEKMRCRW